MAAKQPETSEWYRYMPLQPTEIRLLRLEPGSKTDVLKISLKTYSLDDDLHYDALSYTWGDATNMPAVSCDGKSIAVTRNLFQALQQLRDPDHPRTFWIDAICINQGDLTERGVQVQMMRDIYKKARVVVVWLGDTSSNSPAAFKLMHQLYKIAINTSPEDADKPITEGDLKTMELPDKDDPVWDALSALYWRPWFSRVWVIQEIALAASAYVCCGDDGIHWNGCVDVSQLIQRRRFGRLMDLDVSPILGLNNVIHQLQGEEKPGLMTLLASTRRKFATNPVDYIYALLGISSETSIVPDYTISVADMYRQATNNLMLQSLDILTLASDPWWNQIDGLSSWVPDWSSYQRTYSLLFSQSAALGKPQLACGSTQPHFRFSPDGKTLWIQGTVVDQVRTVGDTYVKGKSDSNTWARKIGKDMIDASNNVSVARTIRGWEHLILRLKTYPTGEDIKSVLYSALVAGRDITSTAAPGVKMEELYQAFRRHEIDFPGESKNTGRFTTEESRLNASTYLFHLTASAYGRRLFVTKRGYVGLGPRSTAVGDSVVLFSGGRTAYVMRRMSVESPVYRYIGEAYAHGWMNGEGFAGQPDMEEFEIV